MRLCPGVAEDHSERDHSPQPGLCHFDAFLHRVGRSARGAHAKAGLDHRRRLREDGVGDDAPDARGRRVAGRRLCRRRRPGRHRSAHRRFRMAQIFVAVLGASSFTFAKATWTQALPDWIDAHVRAFEASGGVPESLRRLRLSAGMRVRSTGPSTEGMLLFAVVRVADVIATGRLPVASFDQSLGCRSFSKI